MSDVISEGFGDRGPDRGSPPRRDQVAAIRAFLDRTAGDAILAMSPYAIARLVALASGERCAPACLAPWTSGVVDPTGAWRHCWFLATHADTTGGLRAAIAASRPARRALHVDANPTCAACVCWRG
jgi:hypothetical protein